MKITESEEGVILEIHVKPKSRSFRVVVEVDEIIVFCREEPVAGKVNRELVKEFSRLLHRKVGLVSGFASRQKRLLVREAEKIEVEHALLHG
jgi:uncharacterized protein (TIGR00251 family)